MGGEGAIGSDIANTLTANGLTVKRIAGTDRYDTAYRVAKELGISGKAVIVNGSDQSYADALSISSWAAYHKVPILYADSSAHLPAATLKAINELQVASTVLIGGEGVLSAAMEKTLPNPVRYRGENRFATNAKVLQELQPKAVNIFTATGQGFADALAGAAVAGQRNAWVILTGNSGNNGGLAESQVELLNSVKGNVLNYHVLGDISVIGDAPSSAIKGLLDIN
jgi:putative cell wall-binding protein